MISLRHQESLMSATGSSEICSPRGSGNYTCRGISNSMQERKGRVGPEIIARLAVRFVVFHWQCLFSGLTERQRTPEARFIKEFSLSLFLFYTSVSLCFRRWVKQKCRGHHESQQHPGQSYAQERENKNWRQITSDPWIVQCVEGYQLEFESELCQPVLPSQANFSEGQLEAIDKEVLKLLQKKSYC